MNIALWKRSLADFVKAAWKIVEPSTPLAWGWHLDAICNHLQAVSRGEILNLLITIPPGCTKSITANVMWPAWVWATDPSVRWLCASNEGDLATRDSLACRYVVESDWYREAFPHVELVGDQNVKTWYQTSRRGHRQAVTVASKVTGKKGDILIVDDPNDAQKVESEAERKTVTSWWKDAFFDRVNDAVTGRRVVIGQRTHLKDLQGFIKETGGFTELLIPEQFEASRRIYTSIGWTDPRQVDGELLRPARFGPTEVTDAQTRLGTIGYRAKHQQDPQTREGYRFKADWLRGRWRREGGWIVLSRPDQPDRRFLAKNIRQTFGTADGAASAKSSADWTVISSFIVSDRNELLWLGCRRERLEIPDQPKVLDEEYARHKLDWVGIEAELSNVALYQHAARTHLNVKRLGTEGKDKLARAQSALIFCEAGRLFLPVDGEAPGYPWDAAEAELLAFTGDEKVDEHDDIVDTLSYAVKLVNANFAAGPSTAPRGIGGPAVPPGQGRPGLPQLPGHRPPGTPGFPAVPKLGRVAGGTQGFGPLPGR